MHTAVTQTELLEIEGQMNFYIPGIEIPVGCIFVFPTLLGESNHGVWGNYAMHKHGANYIVCEGLNNMSYALPIKNNEKRPLPYDNIVVSIKRLVLAVKQNEDKIFLLPDFIDEISQEHRMHFATTLSRTEGIWLPVSFLSYVEPSEKRAVPNKRALKNPKNTENEND